MDFLHSIFGISVLLGICYLLSNNKKQINWKLVAGGMFFQLILAVLAFKVPAFISVMKWVALFFTQLINFSNHGAEFVFGKTLVSDMSFGSFFAFRILPSIVFFSAFTSILYYFNILQLFTQSFAWLMRRSMKLSGAESLSAAANIFVGQTEAPLVIKPYIKNMSASEILCLMTGGMATIAGGVFGAYIFLLGGETHESQQLFARHLLTASLLSAPISVVCAKLIYPETEDVSKVARISRDEIGKGLFDAIMNGTTQGIMLALNVGGALLVFVALIAMCNFVLVNWVGSISHLNHWAEEISGGLFKDFSLEFLFGMFFSPIAWLIGIQPGDYLQAGQLLGEKVVINEFISYQHLGEMIKNHTIHERSALLLAYALCGFANFSSIGIQIGGIGALAPEKRNVIASLSIRALIGGTITCLITACMAGIFV